MSKFQNIFDVVQNLDSSDNSSDTNVSSSTFDLNVSSSTLPLEQIRERQIDTRPLRQQHVQELVESIGVLGLLEPLVVDLKAQLLAGGHRLAAIRVIKEENPDAYAQHFPGGKIPVRVMEFNADEEPERALECEIAENEKRRDYTPSEVRSLAERLLAFGYVDPRGRPPKGTKALRPALEVIVGKSIRTVQRYLNQESTTDDTLSERKDLVQIRAALNRWAKKNPLQPNTPKRQALAKELPKLLKILDAAIEEASK